MTRKLAVFGLAFALAELAAAALPPPAVLPAAVFISCLGGVAAVCTVCRWHDLRRFAPLALGAVCGLAWAAGYQAAVWRPAQALAGQTVHAVATVEPGAENSYADGMLRGTLCLEQVPGYRGQLLVRCWGFPAQEAGERFAADFALEALAEDRYRFGNYADGIYLEAEYVGGYRALPASGGMRFALYRLRQALAKRLGTWVPGPYAGLEAAMLLGERSELDDALADIFRLAGVAHLLAVSGLHVALLCGLLGGHTSRLGVCAQALLILFYMALTGFPVSAVRAGTAFLVMLLGQLLLQPPDAPTSLGLAAVLLGVHNAFAPCDVGFQLSFCAVLGLQAAGALERWEGSHWPGKARGMRARLADVALYLLRPVQGMAFATLATLPVLVAHGMTASGVAILTNLLVVWMLRPALLLGLLVLALSALPVLAPCMRMASLLLTLWLRIMLVIIRWCAGLPMARLVLPRRYTLWVLAVLGALASVFWLRRRRTAMAWYLPAAALCTAVAVALGIALHRDVVTVGVVGTAGNPCAVITQNGQAAVLFRGGAGNLRAVKEYLAEQGDPAVGFLVDLRQQPQPLEAEAEQTVTLEQQPQATLRLPFGNGTQLVLYHLPSGNLAVLDAAGTRVAMMAGNIRLEQPLAVDVYCAGGAYPASVQADTILCNTAHPRWLENAGRETLLCGADDLAIVIRPGRSIIYEGAKQLALQ